MRLAAVQGSGYRCYESGCYQLTSHLPAYDELCLARVASVSKLGVDPLSDSTGGVDVYAGPLAGGAFVFAIFNRGETSVSAQAKWAWAEIEGLGDDTVACTKELFSGVVRSGEKGGTTPWSVAAHDIVVLKVTPGSSTKC